ncbi:MAG: hypothetical protein K6E36_08505 [Oscillospiraceae bacterium]|nr:hypothetical protein [Oscillospiraceae bacterium]MCR5306522.1 hypothetical protein [Oscillospiraceae bacterium]
MDWIIYVLIVAALAGLKKLVPWIREKAAPKEEAGLREIERWSGEHLVRQSGDGKKKQLTYRSDSGSTFALGADTARVKGLADEAAAVAAIYRERIAGSKALPKNLRKDALLSQIRQTFLATMEQYLNALKLFQFDRLADPAYADPQFIKMETLLESGRTLMQHMGDYMQALMQSQTVDLTAERESVGVAVQTVQAVLAGENRPAAQSIPAPEQMTMQ